VNDPGDADASLPPDPDTAPSGQLGDAEASLPPDPDTAPSGHAGDASAEELAAELAGVEAERDAAVAALDRQGRRARRRTKARRLLVGVLVVLFAVLLPLTFLLTWAHNIVLNNNGWERTVGPIASEPAVTSALGADITNQIYVALDPQKRVAEALPPKAAFLAGPITNGAKGYVQQGVTKVLQSEKFQTLWVQANAFAHAQLVDVLKGKSKAVTTTNGTVVLNLVPLFNAALQQIQGFVSGVVGKPVKLPTISKNELPSSACKKISTALHRPVPATCGQIPLFPAAKLSKAQHLVRAFDRLVVLLIILTPVVAALALWLSRRRRRTLEQLTVGGFIGLVVARRVVIWLQNTLVKTGKPQNKAARQAILTQVLHYFFSVSRWFLIGLFVILVIALFTGPYPWARAIRRWIRDAAVWVADIVRATADRGRDDATIAWFRSHLDLFRIGGIVLAVLLLLVLSVSFVGFLIIAVLLAAYELWLWRFGQSHPPPGPPTDAGETTEEAPTPSSSPASSLTPPPPSATSSSSATTH
jgi:hypothetical protein